MADDDLNNHPETSASTPNSASGPQSATKAAKDRSCPFCGQAFTSSSLGRHLDLYIKPKNPKPPDGIHDVDEIKKLRGGITRRQPRASAKGGAGAGNTSGSNGHSNAHSRQESADSPVHAGRARVYADTHSAPEPAESPADSPANARDAQEGSTFFNRANWQATGVINNLPPRSASRNASENAPPPVGQAQRIQEMRRDPAGSRIERPPYESEGMGKLQEAAELGRAAEMALREVLGSLEAASKRVEPKVLFDEFDFYTLSFPGLCLAILPAPTTLFSPNPFPSAESWTLTPPDKRQFEAMTRFVNERAALQRKTKNLPDSVLFKHHTHLSRAWDHWEAMPASDQGSAWQLEILRSYTRGQEKNNQLNNELQQSQQHVRHLEVEYDRLSRCQLPREYLVHPPNTIPISPAVMREARPSSSVAEANYDADALLNKWRTAIKATVRPSRVSQPAPPRPHYADSHLSSNKDESYHATLPDDFIMQGSIWNINGPIPRNGNAPDYVHETPRVSYETPPQPGAVVGADEEDGASNADADAEGEADDDGPYSLRGALTKRRKLNNADGQSPRVAWPNNVLNSNGERPLASGGRSSTRLLREQHDEARRADINPPS